MRPVLLTLPFSHFCEKARWALDRAGVDYVEEGHAPGLHRRAVLRVKPGRRSAVPVLVADDGVVADSTDILAWADARASAERALYPREPELRAEVLALEERFDEGLGPDLRRVLYFHLLPRPALVFALADQRTPVWERLVVRAAFPFLASKMRRFMRIDEATVAASLGRVRAVLDEMDGRLSDGRRFLVGARFTAADLTLAALMSPALMPPEHPIRYPRPEAFAQGPQALLRELQGRPTADHARRMYRDHRGTLSAPGTT